MQGGQRLGTQDARARETESGEKKVAVRLHRPTLQVRRAEHARALRVREEAGQFTTEVGWLDGRASTPAQGGDPEGHEPLQERTTRERWVHQSRRPFRWSPRRNASARMVRVGLAVP